MGIYTRSELEAQAGARARLLTGNADGDDQNRIELSEWKTIIAAVRNRRRVLARCAVVSGVLCAWSLLGSLEGSSVQNHGERYMWLVGGVRPRGGGGPHAHHVRRRSPTHLVSFSL